MSKARECGTKLQFPSRKRADEFCFMRKRKFFDSIHPYKCKFCKMWHVGHAHGLARFR